MQALELTLHGSNLSEDEKKMIEKIRSTGELSCVDIIGSTYMVTSYREQTVSNYYLGKQEDFDKIYKITMSKITKIKECPYRTFEKSFEQNIFTTLGSLAFYECLVNDWNTVFKDKVKIVGETVGSIVITGWCHNTEELRKIMNKYRVLGVQIIFVDLVETTNG